MTNQTKPIRVLFVCLGNICRSPMAEAVFCDMVKQAGLAGRIEADSAGTYPDHVSEPPHHGTQKVLQQHGITYEHRARIVTRSDGQRFNYVVLLEQSNMEEVRWICGQTSAHVGMLLDWAPATGLRDVPDPYYTGGFDQVYGLIAQGCRGLLQHIIEQHGLHASERVSDGG
jgi:protein-tyrosine phosphatase